jgi:hypothetical protein
MREAPASNRELPATPDAVEAYYRALPHHDALATQGVLSAALSEIGCRREPDSNRLRALMALDRSARPLVECLQSDYFVATFQSTPREPLLRHSIVELSRSFANAYDGFLRHMREKGAIGDWASLLPRLLVHLFRHREIELFVSSFCYERWPHHRLRQLNAGFQFALAHGVAHDPVEYERRGSEAIRTVTPEQAYLRILLLRLIDTSAMTPRELVLLWHSIDRLTAHASLRRMGSSVPVVDEGFVIDLSGSDGLVRAPIATGVTRPVFHLDTTPVLARIEREFGKIADASDDSARDRNAAKATLLARLKSSLSPRPQPFHRRGERADAELIPVEALPGKLTHVFRVLRDEARKQAQGDSEFAYSDAVTLGESIAATPVNVEGVRSFVWQVRDYSDSGLRLRGRAAHARNLVPGSLVLTRKEALWTLSIVRWLRKGVGSNFEVGIEHVGDAPQCVIVHPMNDDGEVNLEKSARRPALFLQHDAGSRRSLVLPAEDYAPGRIVTLLSRTSEATVRMRQPLELQRDYVWTSVEILRTRIRLH